MRKKWLALTETIDWHYWFLCSPRGCFQSNHSLKVKKGCERASLCLQLLCLVGEAFDDHSDDVCGAVINIRAKGDKIAIWTTNCENKEAITQIG